MERQFINLTQGDRTVREYEAEFTRIHHFVFNGQDDESTMIQNFMYGLRHELGSRLVASNFGSLTDFVDRAVSVEVAVTS